MKNLLLPLIALLLGANAFGQHTLTYHSYAKDVEDGDTTLVSVVEQKGCLKITNLGNEVPNPILGYVESVTYVSYAEDSVFTVLQYPEGNYYSAYAFTDKDVSFSEKARKRCWATPARNTRRASTRTPLRCGWPTSRASRLLPCRAWADSTG